MPGFLITNYHHTIELQNAHTEKCVSGTIPHSNYTVQRNTLNRFMGDKLFVENDKYIVITEGVILNSRELQATYGTSTLLETVIYMREELGNTFFSAFKGGFSGAIYEKDADLWTIYTSHTGDKAIFYTVTDDGHFAAGSQVNYCLDALRANDAATPEIDEKAVADMLTYGFMESDNTYSPIIKRLLPGCYLHITSDGNPHYQQYYQLPQNRVTPDTRTENELIEELDHRFRTAVRREFDKDVEYGYHHLADLSGGLDSRMVSWVAACQDYRPITNLTYSLAGYLDELIAAEVSRELGTLLLFTPLDDAGFMLDIDRLVSMNFGLSLFVSITGGQRLLETIDTDRFGIEHTGMLGDVVIGTFMQTALEQADIVRAGMYSTTRSDLLDAYPVPIYPNQDLYMLNVRGFMGAMTTYLIRQNYVEVASPFLDVDFMEFCLSIPLEFRLNHYIYNKWLQTKYPEAARIRWEKTAERPGAPQWKLFMRKLVRRGIPYLKHKLGLRVAAKEKNMNPLQEWYDTNCRVRTCWDEYYRKNIDLPGIPKTLRAAARSLYTTGTVSEKAQVLTVLSSIKYYSGENTSDM